MHIRDAIEELVAGRPMTADEARAVMEEIMTGQAGQAQIGAWLIALRLKGETVEELAGMAACMRRLATPVAPSRPDLIDTCGTGGDGRSTFNISTGAALVAAAAGAAVAKHGNRAVSGRSGSADVLEALGLPVESDPVAVASQIDRFGFGFLFAPALHPAMRQVVQARREIGVRTTFNLLGPLTNPAGAQRQLIGVCEPRLTELLARVLGALGAERAWVVHGAGRLDELSPAGRSQVAELRAGRVRTFELSPADFGLSGGPVDDLRAGSPSESAAVLMQVFEGRPGTPRQAVLMNAAAALVVAGLTDELRDAVRLAAEAIDSGRVLGLVDRLRAFGAGEARQRAEVAR